MKSSSLLMQFCSVHTEQVEVLSSEFDNLFLILKDGSVVDRAVWESMEKHWGRKLPAPKPKGGFLLRVALVLVQVKTCASCQENNLGAGVLRLIN